MTSSIRANSVLPARREPLTLRTADGLRLVGPGGLPAPHPVNLLPVEQGENVRALLKVKDFNEAKYVVMATRGA